MYLRSCRLLEPVVAGESYIRVALRSSCCICALLIMGHYASRMLNPRTYVLAARQPFLPHPCRLLMCGRTCKNHDPRFERLVARRRKCCCAYVDKVIISTCAGLLQVLLEMYYCALSDKNREVVKESVVDESSYYKV